MTFKNTLEERCYEIAKDVLGTSVTVTHNQTIKIESALYPEVAAFKGPPTKEVDVLAATLSESPRVQLLVSCKDFVKRAEPAHVQEWAAVVKTMNTYSKGTRFFGLIICPTGFTTGCESWATSHNLGLIPPLKGRRLVFAPDTIFHMLRRSLAGICARLKLSATDLETPPAFFDLVFSLVADFEGHDEAAKEGRYFLEPSGWVSSFGEMYSSVSGRTVVDLAVDEDGATLLTLSEGRVRFAGSRVEFGEVVLPTASTTSPTCRKNMDAEPCTLEFVRSKVIGLPITSAGDFGDYIEFGIDSRFNLGLHSDWNGFHLISTDNSVEEHP